MSQKLKKGRSTHFLESLPRKSLVHIIQIIVITPRNNYCPSLYKHYVFHLIQLKSYMYTDTTTISNSWPPTTSATLFLTSPARTTLVRSTKTTKAITTAPTISLSNKKNNYNSNQTLYGSSSIHKSSKLQPQNVASRKHHQQLLPKIQRTDAPMLNYIFDSISSANKHHHHDHR